MKPKLKPFQINVSSPRGAPMGRMSDPVGWFDPEVPVYLDRVPFVDSCYDQGGAYWGAPANLYCAWVQTDDGYLEHYIRASDRAEAKESLPELKFYR